MSLILKGIDLPRNQTIIIHYANECGEMETVFVNENNIIQVPKGHGRLKDFDADGIHTIIVDGVYMVKVDDLDAIPTILGWEE